MRIYLPFSKGWFVIVLGVTVCLVSFFVFPKWVKPGFGVGLVLVWGGSRIVGDDT